MTPQPGFELRGFRGEADYPGMAVCINETSETDGDDRFETTESLALMYAHLDNCDPYQDMLFAEADGVIAAYSRVTWEQLEGAEDARLYDLFGWVRPMWRRRGIGTAMLVTNEQRLRDIAAGQGYDGPAFFSSGCNEGDIGGKALLEASGYEAVALDVEMVRPDLENLPDALLPDGLEVRPVTDDQTRQIWEASDEAFRDHFGYSPATEEDFAYYTSEPSFDPTLWRVAWEGDEVAGQVRSYINADENAHFARMRGYTEEISVRRPYRRRGVARALLVMSLEAIKERGMTEAGLNVHVQNPNQALRLYESVGFTTTSGWISYRKPFG